MDSRSRFDPGRGLGVLGMGSWSKIEKDMQVNIPVPHSIH